MKMRNAVLLVLAVVGSLVLSAPNDLLLTKRNGADTSFEQVTLADPGGSAHLFWNGTTDTPGYLKANLGATDDPTAADDSGDGYAVGSVWINTTGDKVFVCADATATAAVWKDVSAAGGGAGTWTGLTGSPSDNSSVGAIGENLMGAATEAAARAAMSLDTTDDPTFDEITISSLVTLPSNASPTTDAAGEMAVDLAAWAAGRDAVEFYDGTASTYLLGALASDAPTNGQVPKWNTGGTITWEDDNSGAGGGAFSDAGDPVVLNTTGKEVEIGPTLAGAAKLTIHGDADEPQLLIQGHTTQTSNLVTIENSAGTDVFTVDNDGDVAVTGDVTGVQGLNTDTLKILDNVDQSHGLSIVAASDLTADRNLTITTGDAARGLTLNADVALNQDLETSDTVQFAGLELGHATDTTLARSAAGTVTIEGSEVATTDDTQTLTNKTLKNSDNTMQIYTEKHGASHTISANECYGGVHYVTAAATITLPAAADGMSVTIISVGANAVSVDPNASDLLVLDGATLGVGNKATSPGGAGDIIVLTYYDATGWYAASNTWTDGGA